MLYMFFTDFTFSFDSLSANKILEKRTLKQKVYEFISYSNTDVNCTKLT